MLFFQVMKYTCSEPRGASNDRFVLSKGHAAPILYAAWAEAGLFPVSELMNLRKLSSDLEGHPTPVSDILILCSDVKQYSLNLNSALFLLFIFYMKTYT